MDVRKEIVAGFKAAKAGFKSAGERRKWSARNTVSGVLAITASEEIILNGIGWEAVALALVAVLPICFSFRCGSSYNSG